MHDYRSEKFNIQICGIQINPDGCVVARGFDEKRHLRKIRELIQNQLLWLPEKQSNWVHIPLSGILEPVGELNFRRLRDYVKTLERKIIATTSINEAKLVHETQWYMEKHKVLRKYSL